MNQATSSSNSLSTHLRSHADSYSIFASYLELTKPRLTLLALATTLSGFYIASWGAMDLPLFFYTLLGSALVGGGANALNQFLERDLDAKMKRTESRPLPSRRIPEEHAFIFGILFSITGVFFLSFLVNFLTGFLAIITLVSYLLCYTPLKGKTSLCTLVGAISGAMPPLMGWTAVRGELSLEAWVLFSILFLWQLPHFLAIAWVCREDYARANLPMLPVLDAEGNQTVRQIALYCLALLPVSLIPFIIGMAGLIYFYTALFLGLIFSGFALLMIIYKPAVYAKKFFLFSIFYLFMLVVFMMCDKI